MAALGGLAINFYYRDPIILVPVEPHIMQSIDFYFDKHLELEETIITDKTAIEAGTISSSADSMALINNEELYAKQTRLLNEMINSDLIDTNYWELVLESYFPPDSISIYSIYIPTDPAEEFIIRRPPPQMRPPFELIDTSGARNYFLIFLIGLFGGFCREFRRWSQIKKRKRVYKYLRIEFIVVPTLEMIFGGVVAIIFISLNPVQAIDGPFAFVLGAGFKQVVHLATKLKIARPKVATGSEEKREFRFPPEEPRGIEPEYKPEPQPSQEPELELEATILEFLSE